MRLHSAKRRHTSGTFVRRWLFLFPMALVLAPVLADSARPSIDKSKLPSAIDRPVEQRSVGGLGLWLARRVMDEMHYRRERDRNVLLMRKFLPPA